MNINRHNYETYFLLYVDNELSMVERLAVENFVNENADLKMELESILHTTLPVEKIVFNAKKDLIKKDCRVNVSEENLLLHLDNELEPAAALAFEKQIAADIFLNKDWKALQQTKLRPDNEIRFPNKKLLYKYEERSNVIKMRFLKIAIAAALIGAGIFWLVSLLQNENNVQDFKMATKIENKPQNNISTPSIKGSNNTNHLVTQSAKPLRKKSLPFLEKNANAKNNLTVSSNQPVKKLNPIQWELETIKSNLSENPNKNLLEKHYISIAYNKNILPNTVVQKENNAGNVLANEVIEPNYNSVLFMNEETFKKTKVGLWYRKVKKVIQRTAALKDRLNPSGYEITIKKQTI